MKRSLIPSVIISSCALFATGVESRACGTGSISITNLFSPTGDTFSVSAVNSAGELTGYFYGSVSAHAFLYQNGAVTDLGTLGGSISEGFALNSSGQVVGTSYIAGDSQFNAFASSGGNLLNLGTLDGGTYSSANLINDSGLIAGDSIPGGASQTIAFVYTNGTMLSLGHLGGNYSSAFALNNVGQVAGESATGTGDTHAFVTTSLGLADLGTLGSNYSSAFAINDSGTVAGESSIGSGDIHGFIFSAGAMTDLGTLGGTYSSAYLINSNGLVSGMSTITGDTETHGFAYSGGAMVDLGTLGGTTISPNAMNNRGQIVGSVTAADGSSVAFLWQTNHIIDLNTVLPANSGWQLSSAQFINDAGRVVGTGVYYGSNQWFILDLPSGNNPPVAVAGPDQTVDCQAQATLNGSGSSDPDGDSLTFEWSIGGTVLGTTPVLSVSLPLGTNVVTLKVTDTCGAFTQTNTTVIVEDTTPPNGSCPAPVSASADANCQAAVPNLVAQVVATDNCTPAQALVITQNPAAGTLVGLGPHPVTITVTDASGNSSSCSVLFTVADTTPPTIVSLPPAFTLSVGSDCQAQVPNILPNVVATDSCTPAAQLTKTQNPAAGTPVGTGPHSILVTVTDAAGNNSSASVSFTVADTTAPTILSAPSSVKLSADGHCQAIVPSVLNAVLATDNCTPANQIVLSQNPAAGTVLPEGAYTIVVTATDASGNSSTAKVALEIDDTTPPTILSTPGPLSLSADANCQGVVPNVLANVLATDNCTPANQLVMSQSPAAGTVLPDGQYTIVVTVKDAAGNVATSSIPLSIIDTTAPIFQSISVTPSVLSPPNHQLVPVSVSASVKDNCDSAPVTKIVSITCNDVTAPGDIQITGNLTASLAATKSSSSNNRVYTITVQSTDASGNSSSAQVIVTVPKSGGNGNGNSGTTKH